MNKKYTFMTFLKRHLVIVLFLLVIPIASICYFYFSASFQLDISDWVTLLGAILAYIGTVLVSIVALYQSDKATRLSEMVYELNEREHNTIFIVESITGIDIEECSYKSRATRVQFCDVLSAPAHCKGYQIKIKNCSNYPITHILINTTYHVGRNRFEETLTKEIDTVIASNKSYDFLLCNTPTFSKLNSSVNFVLKCTNLYGYSMEQELSIDRDNSDEPIQYSCKIIDTASK